MMADIRNSSSKRIMLKLYLKLSLNKVGLSVQIIWMKTMNQWEECYLGESKKIANCILKNLMWKSAKNGKEWFF